MRSSILTNYTDDTFLSTIQANLRECKSFYFSVSFIKKAGLDLLSNDIRAAIERGAKGKLITSTYHTVNIERFSERAIFCSSPMHETLCFPALEIDTLTYIECILDYDSDLFPAKTLLQKRLAPAAAVPENLSISLLFIEHTQEKNS